MNQFGELLTRKYGPLPGYYYAVGGTGALTAFLYWRRKRAGSSASATATVPVVGGFGSAGGGGGGGTIVTQPPVAPGACPAGTTRDPMSGECLPNVPNNPPAPGTPFPPGEPRFPDIVVDTGGGTDAEECVSSGRYWTFAGTYPNGSWRCEDTPRGTPPAALGSVATEEAPLTAPVYGNWTRLANARKSVFTTFGIAPVPASSPPITPVSLTADLTDVVT